MGGKVCYPSGVTAPAVDPIPLLSLEGITKRYASVVANDGVQAAALAPVSLVPRADGTVAHFPHLIERAKPGLIAVTAQGLRFTNEANSYHDFMQALLHATQIGRAHV